MQTAYLCQEGMWVSVRKSGRLSQMWVLAFVTIGLIGLLLAGPAAPQRTPVTHVRFQNVTAASDIRFVLENSPTDQKHLIETMPGGVAAFDYDGDGLTDLYFTNGAAVPSLTKDSPRFWNRLYRNLGNFHFQDVTERAGVQGAGYSMGAAAGDYDNDGRVDLFVAGVGRNLLYRNRGDGTFEDVTSKAGIKSDPWSVGAVWLDYDNDGLLDLFVVNYVNWPPKAEPFCGTAAGLRVYCHPRFFEGLANRLYHNLGHGKFEDVSVESGIAAHTGKGMAAVTADYDSDGRPDLFVTNDKLPNFLFHNLGNGHFEEAAFDAGVALLDNGNEISGMGADFRDYNNDGRPDIAATALAGETFPLFQNRGGGRFADAGYTTHLGALTRRYSGWGIGLFDFNDDGWKDIFTTNAHVDDKVDTFEATDYKQPNAIFLNRGDGTFEDASREAGGDFLAARAHRGCAFADFDNDGRIDVVVSALGEAPEIWRNVTSEAGNWLEIKLTGTKSNRDGIGAEIEAGDQHNHMTTAVGYASSSDFGVHFGTGAKKQIDRIRIRWPSGAEQQLTNVKMNQVLQIRETP